MKYFLVVQLLFVFTGCESQKPTQYSPGFDFNLFVHSPVHELSAAVEADDSDRVKAALTSEKANINYAEPKFGRTLLSLAVVNNKPIALKRLLDAGANPNARTSQYGYTPFLDACEYFDIVNFKNWGEMLAIMLDYGANVNDSCKIIQRIGETVDTLTERTLDQPLSHGTIDMLKMLLDGGARLDVYPKNGTRSVLVRSMYNLNVFRYLLIEKHFPIPEYAVIRQAGGPNEKKLSLKDLLIESNIGRSPKHSAVYKEVLAYLDDHPTNQ